VSSRCSAGTAFWTTCCYSFLADAFPAKQS
jgi:hypothetical protein